MRTDYTVPFLQKFNMGCPASCERQKRWSCGAKNAAARYQNYSQGEWQVAKTLLTKTHRMLSEKDDVPSKTGKDVENITMAEGFFENHCFS